MDHGAANPRLKQLEGLTRLKALCDAGVVSLGTFARAKASVLTAAFAGETDAADDAPLLALVDEAPAFADALRAGALTAEANKKKGVYEVFHAFHAACLLHMLTQWRRRGLSIQDFGFLKKEIETLAVRKPRKLMQALQKYDSAPSEADAKARKAMGVSGDKSDFASFG